MSESDKAVAAIERMTAALNRLADGQHATATAINRFCDVYLYVNDPVQDGEPVGPAEPMPDGFRGMP